MAKNLQDYRKSYQKGELTQQSVLKNPFEQFETWFAKAEQSGTIEEINAMTLSTADNSGLPRGRVVLLKEYNSSGFIFYSNYGSKKGQAIHQNNKACISFFWPALEQQIIIQGTIHKISEEKSENYFSQRPRKSQLGALVSDQSREIENRTILENKLAELEKKYDGNQVPKPANWGGYILEPFNFEFWQGRRSRLHDRIMYEKERDSWMIKRLQP